MMRVSGQLVRSLIYGRLQFLYDIDGSLPRLLQFLVHAPMQQAESFFIVACQGRSAHGACVCYRSIEKSCCRFDFTRALGALPECCRTHRLVIGTSFFQFSVDDLLAIGIGLSDKFVQKQTESIRVASRLSNTS